MNYADCINALQEYADAPENAGVDNEFFINVVKFVKEQEDQIKWQVLMKEKEKTQRIKLEKFKEEVIDATQLDDDLNDYEYIDYIKKMESEYDPELKEEN